MKAWRFVPAILAIATSAMAAETAPAKKTIDDPAELKKIAAAWIEKALPLVDKLENKDNQSYLLGSVATGYIMLGKFEQAAKVIDRIKEPFTRYYFDARYTFETNKQNPEAAFKAMSKLTDSVKLNGAPMLCEHFLAANDVANALKAAEIYPGGSDYLRQDIIRHLVKVDHLQEAAELREKIQDKEIKTACTRDVDLRRLLFQKRGEGRKEFIRQTSVEMGYQKDELDRALRRRGEVLLEEENFKEALELADLIEDFDGKFGLLIQIARAFREKGDKEQYANVLAQADALRPKVSGMVYHTRIIAVDAPEVIREIEAIDEKETERPRYESAYIQALLKVGKTDIAAERIRKFKGYWRDLATVFDMIGQDGYLQDAEFILGTLNGPEMEGHARAGFAHGLIKRAAKVKSEKK